MEGPFLDTRRLPCWRKEAAIFLPFYRTARTVLARAFAGVQPWCAQACGQPVLRRRLRKNEERPRRPAGQGLSIRPGTWAILGRRSQPPARSFLVLLLRREHRRDRLVGRSDEVLQRVVTGHRSSCSPDATALEDAGQAARRRTTWVGIACPSLPSMP
jgi:hypothetical protein